MSNLAKAVDRVLFVVIGLLLAAMVADVSIQVFFRYVIQNPPVWTEELARYLFTWQIFLATGLAFGRGVHITVDTLLMVVPSGLRRALLIVTNSIVLGFLILLVWQGTNMVRMTSNTISTALQLNVGVVYAALPVGASIGAIYILLHLVSLLRGASTTRRIDTSVVVE